MVKIAAFVIVVFFLYCVLFAGMEVGGFDIKLYMPNIYKSLIDNIPNGLDTIKQVFLENPFQEVYDLFMDENLSVLEALGMTLPTFIGSSVEFVKGVFNGFRIIFFDPLVDVKPIIIDRSPYV